MAVTAAAMADQTLQSRVVRLESDVAPIRSASNRIWMLLQSAAILGVMARESGRL